MKHEDARFPNLAIMQQVRVERKACAAAPYGLSGGCFRQKLDSDLGSLLPAAPRRPDLSIG